MTPAFMARRMRAAGIFSSARARRNARTGLIVTGRAALFVDGFAGGRLRRAVISEVSNEAQRANETRSICMSLSRALYSMRLRKC